VTAATSPPKVTKQGQISLATCPTQHPHGKSAAAGEQQDFCMCMLKFIFTCTVKTILPKCVRHCTWARNEHSRKPSARSESSTADSLLGKRNMVVSSQAAQSLATQETASDRRLSSTPHPKAMRESVAIPEDGKTNTPCSKG